MRNITSEIVHVNIFSCWSLHSKLFSDFSCVRPINLIYIHVTIYLNLHSVKESWSCAVIYSHSD